MNIVICNMLHSWQVTGARIYLQDSIATELVVLFTGVGVLSLSIIGFALRFVVERKLKQQ